MVVLAILLLEYDNKFNISRWSNLNSNNSTDESLHNNFPKAVYSWLKITVFVSNFAQILANQRVGLLPRYAIIGPISNQS